MPFVPSTNPSHNYELIDSVESTSPEQIRVIVTHAHEAQIKWKKYPLVERVQMLDDVYQKCDAAREEVAQSIAREMGMPVRQARDEVQYGMTYFRWYLDHAVEYLSPDITRETETELHTVYYEPRGVVVAIAPWNYPFSMFVWTCIQALLAGNTVVFKTSKECILTGRIIANILDKSLLPE